MVIMTHGSQKKHKVCDAEEKVICIFQLAWEHCEDDSVDKGLASYTHENQSLSPRTHIQSWADVAIQL